VRFSKHGSVVETKYMIFCSRHYIVPVSCKTFTEGTTERLNSVSCNWKKSLTVKVTRFKVTVELDISVKSVAIELSISWECCNCLYSVCLFVFLTFCVLQKNSSSWSENQVLLQQVIHELLLALWNCFCYFYCYC